MPTFALLADLHLGRGPRAPETHRINRWILETLAERRPDAVLIAGDLHHSAPTPEERLDASDFLIDLAAGRSVLGVAGNHDPPHVVELYSRLRADRQISFYEEMTVVVTHDVAIAMLPWQRRAPEVETLRLTVAERVAAERAELHRQLAGLGACLDKSRAKAKLVLGHLMLREASVAIGQPEPRGGEFTLGLDELGLVRADGYLLGHVHRGQDFTIGDAPVVYPGSTIRRTYGEVERKHIAFVHVDFGPTPTVSIEWVETPATPMVLAEVAWEELEPGRYGFSGDLAALLADAAGADVRVTYAVPEAHRAAAALEAAALEAKLFTAGAKLCKTEESIIPSLRARAPEIAQTSSLREKVGIALGVRGCAASDPRHGRALALFDEINTGAVRVGGIDPAARLHRIRAKGLGPSFAEVEVDLNVDAIPGEFVVITGVNGAGKSSLLECWPAALDPGREMPTRGGIDDLAVGYGKGAFVEVTTSSSEHLYTFRYEPNRAVAHAWLDGTDLEAGGKVSGVADVVRERMLPPEVFASAIFLGQRSEGLVASNRTVRRQALLRAIGVEAIEALAKVARGRLAYVEADLLKIREEEARLSALPTVDAVRMSCDTESARLSAATTRRDEATARAAAGRLAAAAHAEREVQRAAAAAARAGVERRLAEARSAIFGLETRLSAECAVLADAEGIRSRAAATRDARSRAAAAREVVSSAHAAWAERTAEVRSLEAAREVQGARYKEARIARVGAEATLRGAEEVDAALRSLPDLRERHAAAARAYASAEKAVGEMRGAISEATAGRVDALLGALSGVEAAKKISEAHRIATGALAADAAALQVAAGAALTTLEEDHARARQAAAEAFSTLQAAERLAARIDGICSARSAVAAASATMAGAETEGRAIRARLDTAAAESLKASTTYQDAQSVLASLEKEVAAGAIDEAAEPGIDGAEQRATVIEEQLAGAKLIAGDAIEELAGMPPPGAPEPRPDLGAEEAALAAAAMEITSASTALALAKSKLGTAQAHAAELASVRAKVPAHEEAVADWAVLVDALGVSGVQALEIDAAGPAITVLMNDLLHGSFGARYTAEVSATRSGKGPGKAAREKVVDEVEILITDSLKKTPKRDVRTFSGGERVPLASAFSLALAGYLAKSRGLTAPTLVLDEPGSGLDEANVGAWIDMLRAAARMIGASKTLVITHDRRVIDAADAVVEIRDGAVHALS